MATKKKNAPKKKTTTRSTKPLAAPTKGKSTLRIKTNWQEGDPAPDSPVVEELHVEGITYQRKFISCGKEVCRKGCASGRASHGPYWYAVTWNPKTQKTKTTYVGKEPPTLREIAAAVGAEL
jgi:hypothetical protein